MLAGSRCIVWPFTDGILIARFDDAKSGLCLMDKTGVIYSKFLFGTSAVFRIDVCS